MFELIVVPADTVTLWVPTTNSLLYTIHISPAINTLISYVEKNLEVLTAHSVSPWNHRRRREIPSTRVCRRPVLSRRVRPSDSRQASECRGNTDGFSVDKAAAGGGDEATDAEGAPERSVEDTGSRSCCELWASSRREVTRSFKDMKT